MSTGPRVRKARSQPSPNIVDKKKGCYDELPTECESKSPSEGKPTKKKSISKKRKSQNIIYHPFDKVGNN